MGGGGGTICRNSTVSSNRHLEIGHGRSDQHHLDCFRYSWSSAPGLVCFHFFELNSQNCGSWHHSYSLVTMWLSFSLARGFSIYKTGHRMWLRMLSMGQIGTKGPWLRLRAKLLLFGLLWLFSFFSAFSLISHIISDSSLLWLNLFFS